MRSILDSNPAPTKASSQRYRDKSRRDDLELSSPSYRRHVTTKVLQCVGTVDASDASARRAYPLIADLPSATAANFIMAQPTCTPNAPSLLPTRPSSQSRLLLMTYRTVEVAVNELSPRSTQSTCISHATMSPLVNALTNTTVASVIATVEDDTEVPVPRRTTRSQSAKLNLVATFEGFVPANNPDAWSDRDLEYR